LERLDDEMLLGNKPTEFTTAGWPVIQKAAKDALSKMVEAGTHQVIPLPAYDMHGDEISPREYTKQLSGALVQVHFVMSSVSIGSSRTDRFMGTSSAFVF
jgi:hypothetical protein